MPDVKDLVSKFAWSYKLPVTIKDVIAALRELGITDEINLIRDTGLDPNVMQGYCIRWVSIEADGSRRYISDVHYAASEEPWKEKLVCCKELIHILDPEASRVRSEEEIAQLISDVVIPVNLQDPFKENYNVLIDRAAESFAAAVLFPFNARNVLVREYKAERKTIEQIAEYAQLPLEYAYLVMNDKWIDIYKHLLPGRNG